MAVAKVVGADGAEIMIQTGVGVVIKVEPKGGRNAKVVIRANHLREEVTGWVDMQGPVWPRVRYAVEHQDKEIWYRIDVHRVRDVPPEKPFDDLEKREKIRDLVAIERPENAQPVPGGATYYDPPAAPSSAPPGPSPVPPAVPPATAPPAAAPAPLATDPVDPDRVDATVQLRLYEEALRTGNRREAEFMRNICSDLGVPDVTLDEVYARGTAADPARGALAVHRDPDRVGERAPTPRPIDDTPPPAGTSPGRPVSPTSGLTRRPPTPASDARPWEATNSDGRVNLSSYAAGAALEFVVLGSKLLVAKARARHADDPTYELRAPTDKQLLGLAEVLLNVADTVQSKMREGGRVDRMASSHKLARQCVREALDLYPVPWGADETERLAWRDALVEHALTIANVAVELMA